MAETKSEIIGTKRKLSSLATSELRVVCDVDDSGSYIGTHSGTFHCDESLACGMLKMLPAFQNHSIVRSRDSAVLEKCDIVVDVGAVYNFSTKRLDHHQRTFQDTLDGYSTKLSSAGLVYKHFGLDVLREIASKYSQTPNDTTLDLLFHKTYEGFVEAIDGIDNGIHPRNGSSNFKLSTDLSSRVGRLNPAWNEEQDSDTLNSRFCEAVALATGEFEEHVKGLLLSWLPARGLVEEAMSDRYSVHPSGQIIRLSYCPWKSHLFDIEKEQAAAAAAAGGSPPPPVLYALYGDSGGQWRIQAVPEAPDSFTSRRALPEVWRGLRNEALAAATGIPGGVFIHASGFIGGAATYEGALAMATAALEL